MSSNSLPELGKALAVFGTASDVGKSTIAAALCRLLANAGLRVAPYKAQNMSNNSFVAWDGGEIGRAQYVQAVACRIEPSVQHNPVLLKPQADDLSQIVVHGQALSKVRAKDYFASTGALSDAAYASLDHLRRSADVVVMEGAGSCAEVNLRAREFVNFPAAHAADARVLLVADIDKGGVFAQVVGSLEVMLPEDRARVSGVLINKFRGDVGLFKDGVDYLEQRTGVPVLGVVPYVHDLELEAEDAVQLSHTLPAGVARGTDLLDIAVVALPHISNFTDFDCLARHPGVALHYVRRNCELRDYAAVVLPGTKATVNDLAWLRATGLAESIGRYCRAGGKVLGICGGYQMLGQRIFDPSGLESEQTETAGLGLLDVETHFEAPKVVRRVRGRSAASDSAIDGYQIHYGRVATGAHAPLLQLRVYSGASAEELVTASTDGSFSEGVRDDARGIWASSVHGLFDDRAFCREWLQSLGANPRHWDGVIVSQRQWLDTALERIAEHVRSHIDWPRVMSWVQPL